MDNMGRFCTIGWFLIIVPGPGVIRAEEILACCEGFDKVVGVMGSRLLGLYSCSQVV